jgi:NAD(P)-dependent dehydrogenase (short-subunit alcohol dehydrogenase family)
MLLANRICVVTGAASRRGIGRAIAELFARNGASLAILDIDGDAAEASAASLGEKHRAYRVDVTDKAACDKAIRDIEKHFGRVDVLVNNAGITQPKRIADILPADYDAILDVNLRGTFQMSQAAIAVFRRQKSGSLICMSSVSAQRGGGVFGGPHYSAAKAGVLGLAKDMARELAKDGIRVNAICPGLIDTDITGGKLTDDMKKEIVKTIPLGRIGKASDVADACLFLASDLSSYITGSVIDVNGGMFIH